MPSAIQLEQVTKRYRTGRSRTVVDNVLLYLDNNHLSRAGSLFFADKFTF